MQSGQGGVTKFSDIEILAAKNREGMLSVLLLKTDHPSTLIRRFYSYGDRYGK